VAASTAPQAWPEAMMAVSAQKRGMTRRSGSADLGQVRASIGAELRRTARRFLMTQIVRYCRDCAEGRPFEQHHHRPGRCPDAPGGECPEWACTVCGAALLIGVLPLRFPAALPAPARRRVA
jgi:hypothetical protein